MSCIERRKALAWVRRQVALKDGGPGKVSLKQLRYYAEKAQVKVERPDGKEPTKADYILALEL